jgi:hypothetical protein
MRSTMQTDYYLAEGIGITLQHLAELTDQCSATEFR